MKIVPAILSGGAGSRLWPLSRQTFPKPFITLPNGETLIGQTYERALALGNADQVVTVTNQELSHLTINEYRAAGRKDIHNTYILEPMGRDTAAAIALTALHVAKAHGPGALVIAMPADHLVMDVPALQRAVDAAAQLAFEGSIVTFGIRPTAPEVGFGYIEAAGNEVLGFVEKPDLATAKTFVESGRYLWNSGMLCFAADVMLGAIAACCPEVLAGASEALEKAQIMKGSNRLSIEVDADAFVQVPSVSIDYAVMERATNIAVVPCDCGWSDIGSWAAVAALVEPDEHGNRVAGEISAEAARDCFVQAGDRLVGLVGVQDLVIVDTPDALLVAHKDKTHDVKAIYGRLREAGHSAANLHRTMHRPWGAFTVLEEGPRFKIKRLEVKPGASLSLQMHHHRSEHWVIVSGTAFVLNGDREMMLTCDQSTYIPCGNRHRLANPGRIPLVIIEVQSGDYLGEDDIIRFEDVYGRM